MNPNASDTRRPGRKHSNGCRSARCAGSRPSTTGCYISVAFMLGATTRNNHEKIFSITAILALTMIASGCQTTNSIPYKASTANVISIQQSLQALGKKVSLGSVGLAPGVEESPLCRLPGPVVVSPGKSLPTYIKEAFQEELFMAQVYQPNASNIIDGRLEALSFSSVSPAVWNIAMSVKSTTGAGYSVSVKFPFSTSWDAGSACKNVADAFGPAVQELLKQVVTHPQFGALAK